MGKLKLLVHISRRQLLKIGLLSIPWLATLKGYKSSNVKPLRFYIAGVRFQTVKPTCYLGQKLNVMQQHFDQSVSYAIHSQAGERIGYVPKKFVPIVAKQKIAAVRIDKYSPHAVPWKRYRVLLTVEGDVS